MKRILFTTTAIVAFAGAAAADVSWSGSAELGHNDDINGGLYADGDLDVTMSQELDNGVTAGVTFGFDLEDASADTLDTDGNFHADDNFTLFLESDMASLYYGDTPFAAETYWNGVTNMEEDSFSEADGEVVLRGAMSYGGFDFGISNVVHNDKFALGGTGSGEVDQLSLGAAGEINGVSVTFGYQEEAENDFDGNGDFNGAEVYGLSVGTTVGGADVLFAYASDDGEESIGLQGSYAVAPGVTLTAFYVSESRPVDPTDTDIDEDGEDNYGLAASYANGPISVDAFYHDGGDEDAGVNVSYDVGNGLGLLAGWSDDDGQYVAAEYDLGGGAAFVASYAEDEDNNQNDEIGPQEYLHGTTVALTLSF
ncbi:porin [Poseidonocella sedimentorum]|uniref:Porin n=1 Tax=Poseidonocella sedimentorum TaxID=871652 RepID=A0A1I6EQX4_9RHOB|nr:porin [Poseidonocella sedimentorum]SFR20159.1 porin [Poseidonocella sedimentorum]